MRSLQTLLCLRGPLVALALCALLAQQVVGFVLTASPAFAIESGFSLCLSGPLDADDNPKDVVSGAGFCPCTLTSGLALLPPVAPLIAMPLVNADTLHVATHDRVLADSPPTGPPPARAPPANLHS